MMGAKVVLQLRPADWQRTRSCSGPLKILQATVRQQDHEVILNCTGLHSAVVSTVPWCCGELLQVAEVFSGGFAGWSQACYILHQQGAPFGGAGLRHGSASTAIGRVMSGPTKDGPCIGGITPRPPGQGKWIEIDPQLQGFDLTCVDINAG